MQRWIHAEKQRYYQADVTEDFFGGAALVHWWGGIDSHLGGTKKRWYENQDQAQDALSDLAKRRRQRGYAPVDTDEPVVED